MKPLVAIGAALLALFALSACDRTPHPAANGAPAVACAPIGPLPGAQAAAAPPPNPYAQDRAALAEGRRLFVDFNCYGCHGGHGGGGMGPSLRDAVWLYGSEPAQIYSSIVQGRSKGMPAWGPLLPADSIWKLAAYVGSLRTPLEPDPPE